MNEVDPRAARDHEPAADTGKVVWHVTLSLDGFIAGPGDAMDWVFGRERFRDGTGGVGESQRSALVDELIATAGAFLVGRRMGDGLGEEGREIYGGAWRGPVFVLTHHPEDAPKDSPCTFVSGDISDVVKSALAAAGGNNLVVTGGSVPGQCVEAGLVDEIVVHLVPVLLGDGVRFYDSPGTRRFDLERLSVGTTGQLTDFRFRVLR
jgi:dihydrofolate reductase